MYEEDGGGGRRSRGRHVRAGEQILLSQEKV